MSKQKKEVFKHGPESLHYSGLKNQAVAISHHGVEIIRGTLVWVDVYTWGIKRATVAPTSNDRATIVYKGPGMLVDFLPNP